MHSSKRLLRLALSGALAASMFIPSSLAVYQAQVKADSLYLRQSPGGDITSPPFRTAQRSPYSITAAAGIKSQSTARRVMSAASI